MQYDQETPKSSIYIFFSIKPTDIKRMPPLGFDGNESSPPHPRSTFCPPGPGTRKPDPDFSGI